MSFTSTIVIDDSLIEHLIFNALQDASWVLVVEAKKGNEAWSWFPNRPYPENYWEWPFASDGWLSIVDQTSSESGYRPAVTLDRTAIQKGLNLMAQENRELFTDMLADNTFLRDAENLLDYCLYGKIVH